jgi:hypothetical protein
MFSFNGDGLPLCCGPGILSEPSTQVEGWHLGWWLGSLSDVAVNLGRLIALGIPFTYQPCAMVSGLARARRLNLNELKNSLDLPLPLSPVQGDPVFSLWRTATSGLQNPWASRQT